MGVQARLLHFSRLMSGQNWVMEKDKAVERVPINPSLSANDASALYETALAGGGIALLADFITADAITSGRLVQILSTWSIPETHVFAVYPGGGYTPAKTRVFIDYLTETLSAPDIAV